MSKPTKSHAPRETLCLIDAHAYIHRAYHALPPLATSKGEPVNAVFGFARMILKLMKEHTFEYVAVCFDHPSPTQRHAAYAEYKAHRKEADDNLKHQFPLVRELVAAWGLPAFDVPGYEADDVIATLARQGEKKGLAVVIVTGDKDALQLVNDHISVLNEHKSEVYDAKAVEERYGLLPAQLTDYFALTGDASDNVPGVQGIGPKTAVKLLQTYGVLDKVLSHAGDIAGKTGQALRDHKDKALLSRDLVRLEENVPLPRPVGECRPQGPDKDKIITLFRRLEFTNLLPEFVKGEESAPGSYRLITKKKELDEVVGEIRKAGLVSLDLETTGLNPFRDKIVGISLAVPEKDPCYVPVGHDYEGAPVQLSTEIVWEVLGPLLSDPSVKKYGHNLKFDILCLRSAGVPVEGIYFDSMVASYCLNPSRSSHGLKDLSLEYFQKRMTTITELIGKGKDQITMNRVPVERAAPYAADDAKTALDLALAMTPKLKEMKLESLFHDVEMPLVSVLLDMETAGIRVDLPYLEKLREEIAKETARLQKEIHELAGMEFNLNSPKQLGHVLFEKLGLPSMRKTKTGFSTDEEVLKTLSASHPLPAKLMDYRVLEKLKSTYIDALLASADPDSSRVHTSFQQAVAATGRLSSSDPNLQNIPVRTPYGRKIRQAFLPSEGGALLAADYSQIDLRALAHVSGDKVLSEAFRKNLDVHTATAAEVFHVKESEVTSEQRRRAKAINFGIVYGQQAYGLSQSLGIPMAEAKQYIEKYFERYSGVARWIQDVIREAKLKGYVTTLLGRIRYLPEINSPNGPMRGFAERTAMNTPIQGSSADIIKVAMVRLWRKMQDQGFRSRMLLQVHDELVFDVPEGELSRLAPLVKTEMEQAVQLNVPLIVDLKSGKNWDSLEKLS